MSIIYRIVSSKDINALVGLMQELGYKVETNTLIHRLDNIKAQGGEVIVAEINNIVIGCIHALIDIRLAEGKAGEIVSLVVSIDHRSSGVGKKLTLQAESWLKEKGCSKIRIRANELRTKAHNFYLSQGFIEVKKQKIFEKKI